MLIENLGQAITLGSKQMTNLRVFRGEWFEEQIDIVIEPKLVEDLINIIMRNQKWSDLRAKLPESVKQQFKRYGNFKVSNEKTQMISLAAEQASAIIYPFVRTYSIVAHMVTFEGLLVDKESHGMNRFLPQFIKQQMIESFKWSIKDLTDEDENNAKQILSDIQSFDIVYSLVQNNHTYLGCEKSNGVKAFYMIAPDETRKIEVLQALEQHDRLGKKMFFQTGPSIIDSEDNQTI